MKKIVGILILILFFSSPLIFAKSSKAVGCSVTEYEELTAKFTDVNVGTTRVNATGCDIGFYFSKDGYVRGAEVFGASKYGILVNGNDENINVDIEGAYVHGIGSPTIGQGTAIRYISSGIGKVSGSVLGNTLSEYLKNGIVVGGNVEVIIGNNVVIGNKMGNIPQIGILLGQGSAGEVKENIIQDHSYTGSTGLILFNILEREVLAIGGNEYTDNFRDFSVLTTDTCSTKFKGYYKDSELCVGEN